MNWKAKLILFTTFLLELAVLSWYFLETKEYFTEKQQADREHLLFLADSLHRLDSIALAEQMKRDELARQIKRNDSLQTKTSELTALIENPPNKAKEKETPEEREERYKRLAKIYESMKPDAASRVLSRLDLEDIANILKKVKQKQAAKIISSMNPKLAADVTRELLERG